MEQHRADNGLINYFTLISALKGEFPVMTLIYEAHLPVFIVSSNVETFFSHAGQLQDEKKLMSSSWMETLCFLNGQTEKPSLEDVKEKYYELHNNRKGARPVLQESDSDSDSSSDGDGDGGSSDGGPEGEWEAVTAIDAVEPRLEAEVGTVNQAGTANEMAVQTAQS